MPSSSGLARCLNERLPSTRAQRAHPYCPQLAPFKLTNRSSVCFTSDVFHLQPRRQFRTYAWPFSTKALMRVLFPLHVMIRVTFPCPRLSRTWLSQPELPAQICDQLIYIRRQARLSPRQSCASSSAVKRPCSGASNPGGIWISIAAHADAGPSICP
jgi:hypothetical protein